MKQLQFPMVKQGTELAEVIEIDLDTKVVEVVVTLMARAMVVVVRGEEEADDAG